VYLGWLRVDVGDSRGEQRIYASYIADGLDGLFSALIALTAGERRVRVCWEGEPTEYRWWITVDQYSYAHVRILKFHDRIELPDIDGHPLIDADLPLRTFVRSVITAARTMLTKFGEDGYARQWAAGPFPTGQLLTLERWLRGAPS
jgi:hypothetical protein